MIRNDPFVSLFEMSMCLSNAMDLISSKVVDHHKLVSYIAGSIAAEMGLPADAREDVVLAGILHDIGAISLEERLDALAFEIESPFNHAELGYCLLKSFRPFSKIAPVVRFHHHAWDNGNGAFYMDEKVPMLSHVLQLADRVAILIKPAEDVLAQTDSICARIRKHSGDRFHPEIVGAFMGLAKKEYFWFDTVSDSIGKLLRTKTSMSTVELDLEEVLSLAKLFSKIIDFRSRFTATHSSGVSATAGALAGLAGMPDREITMIRTAGYLHDLGKIAVPTGILEKNGPLTLQELNMMKSHSYYTHRIIEAVRNLNVINEWASFHHECIDGSGYPFHLGGGELSLGARIMAVADVFTAISEDRPYRPGMTKKDAIVVMENMAHHSSLDADLVAMVASNYDVINSARANVQAEESREYQKYKEYQGCAK